MPLLIEPVTRLVEATTAAIRLKMKLQAKQLTKAAHEQIHLKKVSKAEQDLQEGLEPLFERQIQSVAKKLRVLARRKAAKAFCPTGQGGGVDPTCSPGGGGGGSAISASRAQEMGFALKEEHERWIDEGVCELREIRISQLTSREGEDWTEVDAQSRKVQGIIDEWNSGHRTWVPEGHQREDGSIRVSDGRHRIAAQLARGEKTIPIVVALQNPKKAFCPTGPGGGVDPTCSPGGGAAGIPKPPKVPAVLQPKYDDIYAAAKRGDRAAVEAVRTNPNAQSPYPKKLHKYKTDVLAAMDAAKPAPKTESPKTPEISAASNFKVTVGAGDLQKSLDYLGLSNATPDQLARAAGALDGAEVNIQPKSTWVSVWIKHPDYQCKRVFDKNTEGKTVLNNASLDASKTGGGVGTKLFHQQVQQSAALGIEEIHTYAAGNGYQSQMNGYYTWPRLGYDGKIPRTEMKPGDRVKLKQEFPKAKNVSDLMKTKEGRDFWKNYGTGASLVFDLKEGSQSRKVLDAYVAAKFGEGGKSGGKSAGDDGRGRGDPRRDLGQPRGRRAVDEVMWDGTASRLASLVFDPAEWNEELVNRALPPLAKTMAQEILRALKELGVTVPREMLHTKASTATEWLESTGLELDDVTFAVPGSGSISMGFATEYPQWMKQEIRSLLQESFEQDYWAGVNETTYGDIEGYLKTGLRDGWSIRKMADSIIPQLMEEGKYAERRAKNIARTESGNALNGARVAAADKLIDEIPELPMKKVWLSVLGDTTRLEHANLDGVPANKDGLWNLDGTWVRWPGDVRLKPAQRNNCQCTVIVSFGMSDASAQEMLDQYSERLWEEEQYDEEKAFCPTGAGGGVDPTCSPGGGAAKPAAGGGSIPKPPKVPAVLQPKYDDIFAAAQRGDRAAVEAIKTNPNAQSPYPKKLHKYKTDVLAAMDTAKPAAQPQPEQKPSQASSEKPADKPNSRRTRINLTGEDIGRLKDKYKADQEKMEFAGIDEERAVFVFANNGYRALNAWARGNDTEAEEYAKHSGARRESVGFLDNYLNRNAGKIAPPETLYRGMFLGDAEKQQKLVDSFRSANVNGTEVQLAGFASMTANPRIATNFSGDTAGSVMFQVKSKKSVPVKNDYELEYVHSRSTRFRVTGIDTHTYFKEGEGVEKNIQTVFLEEV